MDLGETRVLANWQPSKLDKETLKKEFVEKVEELTGKVAKWSESSGIDFRYPFENTQDNDPAGTWHRDCNGFYDEYVVMWSNIMPTEVKLADNTLLGAEAGDIILLHNSVDSHRTPEGAKSNGGRWFARVRLKEE